MKSASEASAKSETINADVVIVGAGLVGAMMAKELANAGHKVLLLEAGRATSIRPEGYASYVENYQKALVRVPNSPYPQIPNAPSPEVTEQAPIQNGKPVTGGYQVYNGPLPFLSNYTRVLGGTTLHLLGTYMRMLPTDLRMQSTYGVGRDWPISYERLEPYYERAELEVGVSADVSEQTRAWVKFRKGYEYPMRQIPKTYLDRWLDKKLRGMKYKLGSDSVDVMVVGTPAGRNGMPNPNYIDPRTGKPFRPQGMPHDSRQGQRCEGNSACVPICPVMAKHNALRTLYSVNSGADKNLRILSQTIAKQVLLNANRSQVTGIRCQQYDDENSPDSAKEFTVTGQYYVIAAHSIETAKLLLASNAANSSDQVGRNLMDHPYFQMWALAPENTRLGVFRGPQITSEIPMRDGRFRKNFAAFRADIRNGGWDFSAFAPYTNLSNLLKKNRFGTKLRQQLHDEVQRQLAFGFEIEQLPDPNNRVTINPAYRDQLGNYRPVLNYSLDEYSQRAIVEAQNLAQAVFNRVGAVDKSGPVPGAAGNLTINGKLYTIYGSGHIVGTHRMGSSPEDSVTNQNLQCWDHDNLYLVGSGSFPTLGTCNPSLTAGALAYIATDHIQQRLKNNS